MASDAAPDKNISSLPVRRTTPRDCCRRCHSRIPGSRRCWDLLCVEVVILQWQPAELPSAGDTLTRSCDPRQPRTCAASTPPLIPAKHDRADRPNARALILRPCEQKSCRPLTRPLSRSRHGTTHTAGPVMGLVSADRLLRGQMSRAASGISQKTPVRMRAAEPLVRAKSKSASRTKGGSLKAPSKEKEQPEHGHSPDSMHSDW